MLSFCWGITNPQGFNRSNLFLQRISNPPGHLAGVRELLLFIFPSGGDRWFRAYCCNELDSIEHNLDEIVDGALIACVGTEGSTVGDDHAAG